MRFSALLVLAAVIGVVSAAGQGDSDFDVFLDLEFYVTDDRPPKPMINVIFSSYKEVAGYQIGFKTDTGSPGEWGSGSGSRSRSRS